jgi:hypothetical protein
MLKKSGLEWMITGLECEESAQWLDMSSHICHKGFTFSEAHLNSSTFRWCDDASMPDFTIQSKVGYEIQVKFSTHVVFI